MDNVVNLVDQLFSDENEASWDLAAEIDLGNYDPTVSLNKQV